MDRSVLIIQPDQQTSLELSRIFRQWGDDVHAVSTLKQASQQLQLTLPDLIVFDITLLGSKWPQSIQTLQDRFQRTELLFT